MLPERISQLDVSIGDRMGAGQLLKASAYEFRYLQANAEQPSVALLMPASEKPTWIDGDIFAPMDQNLPKGDIFTRIRALFPKQQTTAMHLLALMGDNVSAPGAVLHRIADRREQALREARADERILVKPESSCGRRGQLDRDMPRRRGRVE